MARKPSHIFLTRVRNWSPWKNMMNTHLYTLSPFKSFKLEPYIDCDSEIKVTVDGSSNGISISACLKNTFPRQALQSIRSKAGIFSRRITPAKKLFFFLNKILLLLDANNDVISPSLLER